MMFADSLRVLTFVVTTLAGIAGVMPAASQELPGERFQEIIDSAVQAGAPGIALRVGTWDGRVWSGAAGVTSADAPQPVTPDMPFRLHTLSKLPVAALALSLVDDAMLGLDDRIGKWIDPALIHTLPYAADITIRDLIAETSGIRDYYDEPFIFETRANPGRQWRPEELVVHAAEGDAEAPPREGISRDSHTNYVLLGLAIEKVGNAPLAAQLQEKLFAPLGMTETYSWEDIDRPLPVRGHVPQFFYRIDIGDLDLSLAWGAGGIISTTEDIAKLTRALFEGGFLSRSSRALMIEEFRPLDDSEEEYGHGTMRFTSISSAPIGHSGQGVGFGTIAAWWPQTGLIVVVLTNLEVESYLGVLQAVAAALGQ